MVLAVGARFIGQASLSTAASRWTSDSRASVDCARPVIAITFAPRRLMSGRMRRISSDSPELEMAITTSPEAIIPRSPWLASPGCMKKAGVPVEARVEAILPPTWPDLPMPVTTTRPARGEDRVDRGDEGLAEAAHERENGARLDLEHFLREREDARRIGQRPGMV